MNKYILIFLVLFLAIACKMGKNYTGTDVYTPQGYNQADTAVVIASDTINTDSLDIAVSDILWWNLFEDPVLDSLIRIALENNRNALIAAENIMQARFALNIQNAELLPKFNMNASAQRGNYLFNRPGEESNLLIGSGSLYWELDFWGKLRRLSEASRAELAASEYGCRSILISLLSEVASTYFKLLQAKSQLEIAKRNTVSRDSMLIIINARYNNGIVPLIDVNQATVQQTIAAGAVPQYERNVVQLQNALSLLLGKNPGSIATGKTLEEQNFDLEIPTVLPKELLARRPDVLAAEFKLMGQNARVGAAQANRLPTISLSALLGYGGTDFTSINLQSPLWNLGGQLAGPIFYWGQLERKVDIEKSKRFQSLYNYENTVFNALREVEDVLVEIRTTKQEIEIATSRKAAALQAQQLSKARYDKGITSYLEYLEQQSQALDAELLLEQLRSNLLSAYVKLYKAVGGGWLSKEEKKSTDDANQEK